jgi:hypothetical protein
MEKDDPRHYSHDTLILDDLGNGMGPGGDDRFHACQGTDRRSRFDPACLMNFDH